MATTIPVFDGEPGESGSTSPGSVVPGGSDGPGKSSNTETSSGSGGNILVNLYLRQAKSSNGGKIKIQIRVHFFYASYSSTNWAKLNVYLGTSTSGTKLLDEQDACWEWNRVISRNDDDRHSYSQWYDLAEINNATGDINIYATCQPTASYPTVGYQLVLKNVRPSYWLNISADSHTKSMSYNIEDYSNVYGANRLNQTGQYAIVYEGDKITWTAAPKSGYKIDPKDADIQSPGGTHLPGASTINVKAYTYIQVIAKAMATLRMKIGGAWNMYSIYVRRSGAWVQHQAYIRSSNKWDQYS